MKKTLFIAIFCCSVLPNTFATWVTYEVKGVKNSPPTNNGGSVSFDCDYTISTCGTVTVNVGNLQLGPAQGDPTIVTTYSQGQVDGQFTGGWISMSQQPNQNNTITTTVALSNLQQN